MRVVYALTPELRHKFKEPFGLLLRGSFAETMKQLKAIVVADKPAMVVSVGDRVSRNLHEHGINPQLSITDNKSLRRKVQPAFFQGKKVFRVENPMGTITDEAVAAVLEVLGGKEEAHIMVEGEEDLLTLIAVLYAPEGALVVYGQPYEGVVVVKVTVEKRARAQELLDLMACSKAK